MKDAKGHGSDAHGSGIVEAVPSTAYAVIKAARDKIDAEGAEHSKIMNAFPRGPMGLTPDHVKATPEWRLAKAKSDGLFARLRQVNSFMTKNFSKEMKADRDATRQARMRT